MSISEKIESLKKEVDELNTTLNQLENQKNQIQVELVKKVGALEVLQSLQEPEKEQAVAAEAK